MSRLIYCGNCGNRRSRCSCPVPTPEQMAPFVVIDEWLRARGWEDTGNGWKSRTKARVTIATHEEAQRIQRRRDRRARAPEGPPPGERGTP